MEKQRELLKDKILDLCINIHRMLDNVNSFLFLDILIKMLSSVIKMEEYFVGIEKEGTK